MIKINLLLGYPPLPIEQQKLNRAIYFFNLSRYHRSYSSRHPEMKKFNCPVCERRHEKSLACVQQFAINRWTKEVMIAQTKTLKGAIGAKQFAGRRHRPHRSHGLIIFHNRIDELFQGRVNRAGEDIKVRKPGEPFETRPLPTWQPDIIHCQRQARQELQAKIRKARRRKARQQDVARRINFGLLRPGTRATA